LECEWRVCVSSTDALVSFVLTADNSVYIRQYWLCFRDFLTFTFDILVY